MLHPSHIEKRERKGGGEKNIKEVHKGRVAVCCRGLRSQSRQERDTMPLNQLVIEKRQENEIKTV